MSAEAAAAVEAVPQGPFDVAISATSEDGALAQFIKGKPSCLIAWSRIIYADRPFSCTQLLFLKPARNTWSECIPIADHLSSS